MAATAGAFSLVTAKPGRTATARSMNSRTAAYWPSAIGSMVARLAAEVEPVEPGQLARIGRRRQARDRVLLLARDVEDGAARDDRLDAPARRAAGRRRSGAAAMTCSKLSRTSSRRLSRSQSPSDSAIGRALASVDAEGRRDPRRDEHRVADRFERHEEDPVGEVVGRPGRQLQRQPGLAGPARTGQRQQPGRGEQPGRLVELRVAPDERRQLDRQVVRPGVERPERRERRRQAVGLDLEDAAPARSGP